MRNSALQALPAFPEEPAADWMRRGFAERSISAQETLRNVWPHLPAFGITRVGRQTGLDRLGIHSWTAVRPNAKALSVAQGKGTTDASACVSAVMEAVEIAVAEGLSEARLAVSKSSLRDFQNGTHLYDASRLLPPGQQLDPDRPIRWLRGEDLHTGRRILVPQDAVDLDAERSDIPGICKHSSGLASGNDRDEATFHAICELIERDGTSLWSLLGQEQKLGTCFSASSLGDGEVSWLYQVITDSGYRLSLFDQTSNLGVPVVMAVLGPADQVSVGETEITSGYGCHPVGAIAALRAITEAAQGRVTAIASTRDDIDQSSFGRRAPTAHLELLRATPCRRAPRDTKIGLTGMLGAVKTALGINGCVASMISLAPANLPFSVVRVLCFDLEDRSANVNWRPGRRAFEYVERNLR